MLFLFVTSSQRGRSPSMQIIAECAALWEATPFATRFARGSAAALFCSLHAASGNASAPMHMQPEDFRAWRLSAYRDYNTADAGGGGREFRVTEQAWRRKAPRKTRIEDGDD